MTKSDLNQEIQARTPSTCGSRRPSMTPTTLPRPASAILSRRLSENNDSRRPLQRISSELSWKPNLVEPDSLRRSTSCASNSLQPPVSTIDLPSFRVFRVAVARSKHSSNPNLAGTNIFLQRVFGVQQQNNKKASAIQTVLATTPRSPRIMITRAFSEESESSPPTSQRAEVINKTYSSSTTLLDKKWKKLRYQEETQGSEMSLGSAKTESESLILATPKRVNLQQQNVCQEKDVESDSSSTTSDEEHSSGNIYFPFDETLQDSDKETRRRVSEAFELPLISNGSTAEDDDAKSCDGCLEGIWMKSCGGEGDQRAEQKLEQIRDVEVGVKFYHDTKLPSCILSWPTRRKNPDGIKQTLTRSTTDLTSIQYQI